MVGDGDQLSCNSMCSQVQITLDNIPFHVDSYVLPMSRVDVVLGVQWLKTLALVLTVYSKLTMKFIWNEQEVQLQEMPEEGIEEISASQLKRLEAIHSIAVLYNLE